MIKRLLGSALRTRSESAQAREIVLRAITHNVMIVRLRVFYRAVKGQYPPRNGPPGAEDYGLTSRKKP